MRVVTDAERRAIVVARHSLDGSAPDALAAVDSVVALHATDPATVSLSVLARCRSATIDELAAELYEDRSLVRWMAMRRTLFVVRRDDVPLIQAAAGAAVAGALRRRLIALIGRNATEPRIDDVEQWVVATGDAVDEALGRMGDATGAELSAAVPGLRVALRPRSPDDRPPSPASMLLTVLGAEGRIVRSTPVGAWRTRAHRWAAPTRWWPEGLPIRDPESAEADLARRWLERFGPATEDDLRWWTGWGKSTTRRALARLAPDLEDVDLAGRPGLMLKGTELPGSREPVAALLPALDPTPMGWRHREWFTAPDPALLYDTAGNIGPTIWWEGEIVGVWAAMTDGVRTRMLVDRGSDAADAIARAAEGLTARLGGSAVVPAARTPTERELSRG